MSTPFEFPTPSSMSRKVFISYAREDRESLEEIREGISALHHQAWIDSNLDGGQAWWDVILEEIRHCDAMVLAVSPSLLESEAAAKERDYARQLGKPLIPLVVAEVRNDLLPPDIATLQFIDYTQRTPLTGVQLANALYSVPTGDPLPDPLPHPPAVPVSYLGRLSNLLLKPKLSADEQFSMTAKLAASLGRPREHGAAVELLRRLEDRPDLYYQTAKDIERIWQEEANRPVEPAPSPETLSESALGKEPEPADARRVLVPDDARRSPAAHPGSAAPGRESPAAVHPDPHAGPPVLQAESPQDPGSAYPPLPGRHWALTIVATVLSVPLPPLGIVALYFASQVANSLGAYTHAGSLRASIVAVILFLPLPLPGIIALYFTSQIASRWGAGVPAGALVASKKVKIWGWTGILASALWWILVLIVIAGLTTSR